MSKLILLLSLFGTTLLFTFGLTDPTSPVMWLASTSIHFAWLRIAMMVALSLLLVTHPPRNVYLRIVIGTFVIAITGWDLYQTYINKLDLLDTLSILLFSVSAGLAVLESSYLTIESEEERLISARTTRQLATN